MFPNADEMPGMTTAAGIPIFQWSPTGFPGITLNAQGGILPVYRDDGTSPAFGEHVHENEGLVAFRYVPLVHINERGMYRMDAPPVSPCEWCCMRN